MKQISFETNDRVLNELLKCVKIGREKYNLPHIEIPDVTYDVKGTYAGWAHCREWKIRLNGEMMMDHLDKFIESERSTVKHEMAHLITHKIDPSARSHGKLWKSVCKALGHDASRCHDYDVTKYKTRTYNRHVWACPCGKSNEVLLTAKKHKRQMDWIKQDPTGTLGFYVRNHKKCGRMVYLNKTTEI